MRIKKLLSITAVALSFMMVFSVLNAPMVLRAADEGENLTVTIFSIGDFHGFLTSEQSASDPGAPRFVTYVEEQLAAYESETGHRPIVVLAGDNYFGQSISNLFGGEPSLRVLNRIGARYTSLGNHEFSFHNRLLTETLGETNQASRAALMQNVTRANPLFDGVVPAEHHLAQVNAGITILAADVVYEATGEFPSWVKPYTIIDDFYAEYGVRIGMIGLMSEAQGSLVGANDRQGLYFRTPNAPGLTPEVNAARYEWLEEMINMLRDDYGVAAVVALTHVSGGTSDLAPTNVMLDTLAARGNAHFDAWLAGHSHSYHAFIRNENPTTGFLGTAVACGGHHGRGFGAIQLEFANGELVGLEAYMHGASNGNLIRESDPDPEVFAWVWGPGATWERNEANPLNLVINYEHHNDAPAERWGYVQVRNAAWDIPLGTRGLYGRNQHTRNQFLINLAVDYIDRVHAQDVSFTTGQPFDGTIISFAQSGWRGQDASRLQWTPDDMVTYMDLKDALTFERFIPLFEMRGRDVIELLNKPGHNLAPPPGEGWGRWPEGHPYAGQPNWGSMQGQTIGGAFFHNDTWHLSATMQPINPNGVYRVGMAHNLFNGFGGDGSQRWATPGNIQGDALGFEVIDFGYFANNPLFTYGPRHWARDAAGDPLTYWDIWAEQLEYRSGQVARGQDIAAWIEVTSTVGGTAALEVWGMETAHVGQGEGVVGSGGTANSNHSRFGGPSLAADTSGERGTWEANPSQRTRDLVLFGTPVRVTATPDPGLAFQGWFSGGTLVSTDEVFIFQSTQFTTLEARFAAEVTIQPAPLPEIIVVPYVTPPTPPPAEELVIVGPIPPGAIGTGMVVNCYYLYVRASGTINARAINHLRAGDVVTVYERGGAGDAWYRISFGDVTGWVFSRYLEVI